MLVTEYAQYYNIEAQRAGESDLQFRGQVAGALRDAGNIIEAHEAYNDAHYEDGGNVLTGIIGAIAQAMQGIDYGSHGERQIGDDFAAGVVAQAPKQDAAMLLLAMALFGGRK